MKNAQNKRRELAARAARGERQVTVFLNAEDIGFIDEVKRRLGVANRTEALAVLIKACRDRGWLESESVNNQESNVPSG